MTTYLLFAARNLYRHWKRSAIALGSIAFGMAALLLAGGFIEWGLWFGRDSIIHSQLGHLQITRTGFYATGVADPFKNLLPHDDSNELDWLKQQDRVEAVGPRLLLSGLISHGESSVSFIGDGVDPDAETLLSKSVAIHEGRSLTSDDPKGAILGQGLAANLGVKVGDPVVLLTSTESGGVNAIEVTVRGIFSTITKAYDDAALRIPIATARSLLRVKGAHVWVVLLNDDDQVPTTAKEISLHLATGSYQVHVWRDLTDFFNKTEALLTRQFMVVQFIISIIILLSIGNTMMMSVLERTSEIGTVMALGGRRTSVMWQFISEGILLGLVGVSTGLLLGVILAHLISQIGIPMPPAPGMSEAYVAEIMLTWPRIFQSGAIVFSASALAVLYPAWRGSRMVVIDALRSD